MIVRSLLLLTAFPVAAAVPAQQTRPAKAAEAFRLDALAPTTDSASAPEAPVVAPPEVPDNAAVTEPSPEPAAVPAAPSADAAAAPTSPADAAAAATATRPGFRASFTLDTPIADLIADPAARAVLDKDLPGLSTDQNLDKFAKIGLRQFQPLTGGQLTNAMLLTVARDLSRLSGPLLAPVVPAAGGTSKRNRDTSR